MSSMYMYAFPIHKPKINDLLLLAIVLFSTVIISFGFSTIPFILLQISMLLKSIIFNKNKTNSAKEIIAALLISPEPGLFFIAWIVALDFILKRRSFKDLKVNRPVLLLLWLSFSLFIYNFFSEKIILNYLFWISTFLSGILLYLYGRSISRLVHHAELIRFITYCLLLQLFVFCFQFFQSGSYMPGDWARGTIGDAHKLGIFLQFSALFFLFKFFVEKRLPDLLIIFILSVVLYFCDAKAAQFSTVVGILIYFGLNSFSVRKTGSIFIFGHAAPATIILIAGLFFVFLIVDIRSILDDYIIYIDNEFVNSKYVFFNRVWFDILDSSLLNWIFGTGPGTLGSRASNILSADVLYKMDGTFLANEVLSSEWTRFYMRGLWTPEIAQNVGYYSAVLTYPFSGITSIKGELGIIGLILYFCILFGISKKLYLSVDFKEPQQVDYIRLALSLSLVIFFVCLFFDNFHEQPSVGYLVLFLSSLFYKE